MTYEVDDPESKSSLAFNDSPFDPLQITVAVRRRVDFGVVAMFETIVVLALFSLFSCCLDSLDGDLEQLLALELSLFFFDTLLLKQSK